MTTEFDSLPLFAQSVTPIAASLQRVAQAIAAPRPAPAASPAAPPEPLRARPLSVEEADALRRGEPMPGPDYSAHLARFDSKWVLDPETGCHTWTEAMNRWGYGVFRLGNTSSNAHRCAYILKVGPVPSGMVVDHTCNNRACVNPDHLRVCTQKENIHALHSNTIAHRLSLQTHCLRGHEFTPENTYLAGKSGNQRSCRECMREHKRINEQGARLDGRLQARAARWMKEHPDAMALFERFSLELGTGIRRFGMKAVAERVRWECLVTKDTDYKINNPYVSYVARELVRRHPHLAEHIEFRRASGE